MKFLETITVMGNDVLIPIDRIKHITLSYKDKAYRITITSDDGEWEEGFEKNTDKATLRYEMIKKIIKGK